MSEEDTQAGNDQPQTDDANATQETGEGQQEQTPAEVEELRQQLAAKDEELKNTNAYITRIQQGQPATQQPETPETPQADTEPDDGSQEYEQYGLTKEQVNVLRKVTGADEARAKLAEYEKRDAERQQTEQQTKLENDFASVAEKYKDKDVPVPTTPAEKEKLLNFMSQNGIFNMDVAFREMNAGKLNKPAEQPKAAVSDRSDATPSTDQTAYKEALKAAGGDMNKIAEVETRFHGAPRA